VLTRANLVLDCIHDPLHLVLGPPSHTSGLLLISLLGFRGREGKPGQRGSQRGAEARGEGMRKGRKAAGWRGGEKGISGAGLGMH